MKLLLLGVVCGLVLNAAARENNTFGNENQQWGYVEVRPGAQIFYWLYHTTASKNITEKPLIIVIPGGPGIASTVFSNFEEIGPLDVNLNPRNTSWVHKANVLFVDSPVGAGFSFVKSDDLYATTDEQVAEDFVNFLRGFYKAVPIFNNVPVYIFSYGYAAKTAVGAALKIHQAVKNNTLTTNFKGVGLGSSWISPIDNILFIPAYLYQLGYVDYNEFSKLSEVANQVLNLTTESNWNGSLAAYLKLIAISEVFTGGVNIFNLLETKQYDFSTSRVQTLVDQIKTDLNLNSTSNGIYNEKVYSALAAEFNKPATDIVDRILNETDIFVAVYNGQFDGAANILGAISWLSSLQYSASEIYQNSTKEEVITINGVTEVHGSESEQFAFYTVLRAGHLIARDNPNAMLTILDKVTHHFRV